MSVRQGLFNFLDSKRYLRQFSPEEQKRLLQEYRKDIGLTTVDLKTSLFDDHASNRVHNFSGLKLQLGSTPEDTLDKKLVGNEPGKSELRNAIAEAFAKQPFYERAQKSFNESMEAFKELVKKVPEHYTVEGIRGELDRTQNRARRALEAQQKIELKNIDEKVTTESLQTVLGLNGPDIDKIKVDMLEDLKKTHKAQLDAFDKEAAANLVVIDKAAAAQMDRIIFTAQLESFAKQLDGQKRQDMQDAIEAARLKMKERIISQGNTALVDINETNITISAIDPKDLSFMISLTGKKITQEKPGLWSMEFSPRIWNPGYYLGFQEKPKVDLLTMAQAVKASGFGGITMTLKFSDPDTQKKRMRQAYEACLEAGFAYTDKDKNGKEIKPIKLIDGNTGKEVDPATIFSAEELQRLHQASDERRKELAEISTSLPKTVNSPQKTQEMRKDSFDFRNKTREPDNQVTEESEKLLDEEIDRVIGPPQ